MEEQKKGRLVTQSNGRTPLLEPYHLGILSGLGGFSFVAHNCFRFRMNINVENPTLYDIPTIIKRLKTVGIVLKRRVGRRGSYVYHEFRIDKKGDVTGLVKLSEKCKPSNSLLKKWKKIIGKYPEVYEKHYSKYFI